VILPGFETLEAEKIANEIRAKFERTSLAGPTSSPAFVTVSSGLASFPEHGANASELIEAADKALYQAKRQGRNQVAIAASSKPR
jgi:diguanylate cyclase (GGDEF)-like protein